MDPPSPSQDCLDCFCSGTWLIDKEAVVNLEISPVSHALASSAMLDFSGDPEVALIYSVSSEENIESSSISSNIPALITANLDTTWKRHGIVHASPELVLGTRVQVGEQFSE